MSGDPFDEASGPNLNCIGDDVIARRVLEAELRLLRPEVRASRADVEALLACQFTEVGQSGRLWTRSEIVDALSNPDFSVSLHRRELAEERVIHLAGDHYLLTYVLKTSEGCTRRSSIWAVSESECRIVFHQGTRVGMESFPIS